MDTFHEGELEIQALAGEETMAQRNGAIVSGRIMRGALPFLKQRSMAVVAYADRERRLWVSLIFGQPGFLRSENGYLVELDLAKSAMHTQDPLWASIGESAKAADARHQSTKELARPPGGAPDPAAVLRVFPGTTPAGMLAIDLANRRRIRFNGDLSRPEQHLLQLSVRESYPNCPKYITRRTLRTIAIEAPSESEVTQGTVLTATLIDALTRADVLFIGTAHPERGLDASHRGGPPGFVEVLNERTLQIPDYVGNSMFNTLGNLAVDARAAITVPDFAGRQLLQLTGRAETLWHQPDAREASGGTHRFLRFHVNEWNRLPMPAGVLTEFLDYSPFNPQPR